MTIFLTKLAAIFGMLGGFSGAAYSLYSAFMYVVNNGVFPGSTVTDPIITYMTLGAVCMAIYIASEIYDNAR